jgi:hypothetical protein
MGIGMTRWNAEDFSSSENTLYEIVMVGTSHYTFVQIYKCAPLRVDPNVNNGFWVIM